MAESFEEHRPLIHRLCYRMTGSWQDAEDLTQEALLKAWQGRGAFRGDSSVSTWLYRVACNLCLDFLRKRKSRALPGPGRGRQYRHGEPLPEPDLDVAWLEPYPTPEDMVLQKERISLAFVALLQTLPARQRAVLLVTDVLEYSAKDAAALLGLSMGAVNSALQRARRTVGSLPEPDAIPVETAEVAGRFVTAWEKGDAAAIAALLADDAVMVMPPYPVWVLGRADILRVHTDYPLNGAHRWKLVPVGRANGDPAFGFYTFANGGWQGWGVQVISVRGATPAIDHYYVFKGPHLLSAFGLPMTLDPGATTSK